MVDWHITNQFNREIAMVTGVKRIERATVMSGVSTIVWQVWIAGVHVTTCERRKDAKAELDTRTNEILRDWANNLPGRQS